MVIFIMQLVSYLKFTFYSFVLLVHDVDSHDDSFDENDSNGHYNFRRRCDQDDTTYRPLPPAKIAVKPAKSTQKVFVIYFCIYMLDSIHKFYFL